jgi:hypothetical protein
MRSGAIATWRNNRAVRNVFICGPCRGVTSRTSLEICCDVILDRLPCEGGVEYLHRKPMSRRRRRKGKSRIWDNKIWSRVSRDSDPKMTALARVRSSCKRQNRPLVTEDAAHQETRTCMTVIEIWSWALSGGLTRRQTSRLTVGRNIILTLTMSEFENGSRGHCWDPSPGNEWWNIDWDGLLRAVVNCRACELAIALSLLVVTTCKCSVNPITNPTPYIVHIHENTCAYTHTHTHTHLLWFQSHAVTSRRNNGGCRSLFALYAYTIH